jgi:hypothetical protein
MRTARLFTSTLALVLATLAFAFIITSTTSNDWARQNHYNSTLDQRNWSAPLYATYRSPFTICKLNTAANSSTPENKYPLSCVQYRPYGFASTSCESVFATQSYRDARSGDERLCQQVHFAGNLSIASTVFIGIAFLVTCGLFAASALPRGRRRDEAPPVISDDGKEADERPAHASSYSSRVPKSTSAFANVLLITSLAIGACCALLAQFYGLLAFIMSAPDQGAFALARGNAPNPTLDNSHGPWIQGRAMNAYLTLAWVCSVFAAGIAGATWRLPSKARHGHDL